MAPSPPPHPPDPRQRPDNNNIDINNNIFGVSNKIAIKSQPQVPYKVVPKQKTTCISNLGYEIPERSWQISCKKRQPSK